MKYIILFFKNTVKEKLNKAITNKNALIYGIS